MELCHNQMVTSVKSCFEGGDSKYLFEKNTVLGPKDISACANRYTRPSEAQLLLFPNPVLHFHLWYPPKQLRHWYANWASREREGSRHGLCCKATSQGPSESMR